MRIQKVLSAAILGVFFMVSANAATKCVALDSSKACTGATPTGQINWTMTCSSIPITGVGACSSASGTLGQTTDTLATEDSTDANKYCWCKMTSPAVSRFVHSYNYQTASACSDNCAYGCVKSAVTNTGFRAGLFSGLTN